MSRKPVVWVHGFEDEIPSNGWKFNDIITDFTIITASGKPSTPNNILFNPYVFCTWHDGLKGLIDAEKLNNFSFKMEYSVLDLVDLIGHNS